MQIRQGNITGSVSTIPLNVPCTIVSGYFTNRTNGTITINVYVATETGDRAIVPLNLILISGTLHVLESKVVLKAGYYLIVVASGSCDYYFSMK